MHKWAGSMDRAGTKFLSNGHATSQLKMDTTRHGKNKNKLVGLDRHNPFDISTWKVVNSIFIIGLITVWFGPVGPNYKLNNE